MPTRHYSFGNRHLENRHAESCSRGTSTPPSVPAPRAAAGAHQGLPRILRRAARPRRPLRKSSVGLPEAHPGARSREPKNQGARRAKFVPVSSIANRTSARAGNPAAARSEAGAPPRPRDPPLKQQGMSILILHSTQRVARGGCPGGTCEPTTHHGLGRVIRPTPDAPHEVRPDRHRPSDGVGGGTTAKQRPLVAHRNRVHPRPPRRAIVPRRRMVCEVLSAKKATCVVGSPVKCVCRPL
jgi:hypothetical protein